MLEDLAHHHGIEPILMLPDEIVIQELRGRRETIQQRKHIPARWRRLQCRYLKAKPQSRLRNESIARADIQQAAAGTQPSAISREAFGVDAGIGINPFPFQNVLQSLRRRIGIPPTETLGGVKLTDMLLSRTRPDKCAAAPTAPMNGICLRFGFLDKPPLRPGGIAHNTPRQIRSGS